MRALVTGSAGFVGRHFATELRARGWFVDVHDIVHGRDVLPLFAKDATAIYDLVVHAAAMSPHRAAIDAQPRSHIYNRMLDASMFDWAIRTGQRRLLYLSSCAVLDETPDDYGLNKLAGEQMAAVARRAGLPVTVVRPFSGYGEDQSEDFPFGAFVARARRREDPFPLWNATAVRDWIHVDDLVGASLAAVSGGVDGPLSLCTGVGTSIDDVAAKVCDMFGYWPEWKVTGEHPGVDRRVGDPTEMLKYYTPKIDLKEGIRRAL
jgi:nucleoside-diphosphate-sugar epimerase